MKSVMNFWSKDLYRAATREEIFKKVEETEEIVIGDTLGGE